MQKIKNSISNINTQQQKILNIEAKREGQDFLFKNSFQKVFLIKSVTNFIQKVTAFVNNEDLSSEEILDLKKEANRLKNIWIPLFNNDNKDIINNHLKSIHQASFVVFHLEKFQNPSSEVIAKDKSLDTYFLYRNILEERRYRKAVKVLAKRIIPHLDRAYSLKNEQKPT
mgnify:FL=1|tara:strand:- start:972 stop:1481 length:510 start_codon:yes stop_codon:yes gene_type:complete